MGSMQLSLLGDGPAGFSYHPGAVGADEAAALLRWIATLSFHEIRMRGRIARRTVVHFGWTYGYDDWRIAPGPPIPPQLEGLRARAALLGGVPPAALEQALVARYVPGAGIGWHRDAQAFGEPVVGFSLGGPALLRLREGPGAPVVDVPLAPGSAYVLAGPARWRLQHGVPPVKALRYAVTFRTLRRAAATR